MIRSATTLKGSKAITSDQWHVVHSRFTVRGGRQSFVRAVSSEHPNRAECVQAARALRARLAAEHPGLPALERDEVLVRRPDFKSLERTRHRCRRPK